MSLKLDRGLDRSGAADLVSKKVLAYGYAKKSKDDSRGAQILVVKRAKWVTPDILAKRREANRCLRCGRDNCRVATCPLKMAKRPGMSAPHSLSHRTTSKRAIVTEAQFEEDDEILEELEDRDLKA